MKMLFKAPPHGCPADLDEFIAARQRLIDDAHHRKVAEASRRKFHCEAVKEIAGRMLAKIEQELRLEGRHARQFVPSKYHKSWAFSLLTYCRKHGQPAPPRLMDLIFDALGCRPFSPDPQFLEDIGLTSDISMPEIAAQAAEIDGRADAAGESVSQLELGRRLNVSRTTVARWRAREDYQATRDYIKRDCLEMYKYLNK